MKSLRFLLFVAAMVVGVTAASAQADWAGRVYENKNVLAGEMDKMTKDSGAELAKARTDAIKKAEEKKGRKLTTDELAEVDKQVAEAKKLMEAMKKGFSTAVSVEFKSATELVMRADMKVSEEVLKAAGIGWAKRKAMKAALALAPKSQKMKYSKSGNLIVCDDGKEKDTLRVSDDGQYLYGKMDEKTSFKLTRMK